MALPTTETLQPLIITYNCGREYIKPFVFASHIVHALPTVSPDIIVISLQEIAPIAYGFLGGFLLRPYLERVDHAIKIAAELWGERTYIGSEPRNIGLTAIFVYVREDVKEKIEWLGAGGTGVGLHEMGNKGAVGIRLGYASSTGRMDLTFVAAHLAPMEDACLRRNADWQRVVENLVFTSDEPGAADTGSSSPDDETQPLLSKDSDEGAARPSGIYAPTSHAFVAGDLNYRTSSRKPTKDDMARFPQPNEHADSPRHYRALLKHDQLTAELRTNNTLHGFTEPPLDFPPTYKYSDEARASAQKQEGRHQETASSSSSAANDDDNDDDNGGDNDGHWAWATHRWPSWCDRILYMDAPSRTQDAPEARITPLLYRALALMSTSDHRPVIALFSLPAPPEGAVRTRGLDPLPPRPSPSPSPPFAIDPRWREKRAVARRKEIVTGLMALFTTTWEGRGAAVLAAVAGTLGGYAITKHMSVV